MEMHLTSKKHGTHIVYFDIEDWDKIKDYTWSIEKKYNCMYTSSHIKKDNIIENILMHRYIMNAPSGMSVDHINHNGLDNRKSNLRICTHAENIKNQRKRTSNKSGYKGVSLHINRNKYVAQIVNNGKQIHLGCFNTGIEAAKAYNDAAIKYFGEFASLNEILL